MLDEAEAKVLHIAEQGSRGQQNYARSLKDLLVGVVERIEELYNRDNPSDVTGVATGFADLDRMTAGLQPGDLVIVAGRPSMGKAQPLDAKVRARAGWKRMGDLAGRRRARFDRRRAIDRHRRVSAGRARGLSRDLLRRPQHAVHAPSICGACTIAIGRSRVC